MVFPQFKSIINLRTLALVALFSLEKGPSLLPLLRFYRHTFPFRECKWFLQSTSFSCPQWGECTCPPPLPRPGMPSSSGSLDHNHDHGSYSQSSWARWNLKTSSQAKPKLFYFLAVFSRLLVVLFQGIMIRLVINMSPWWLMHQIKINVHRKNSVPQEFFKFTLPLIFP